VEDNFEATSFLRAPQRMTAAGSRALFSGDVSGHEPWTSDGTAAGTHEVAEIAPIGGSDPDSFVQMGSLVFFTAHSDATGRELWAVPVAALADGDQDGLEDQAEVAEGTNPDDADSDNDGLSDGAEVLTHGTDPLDADTDGDGYTDGEELVGGSDPLDPESVPQAIPFSSPWGLAALAALLLAFAARRLRQTA